MAKTRILFCCLGNICRSPTAQGVFERLLEETGMDTWVEVDSAGTHGFHIGACPDERATEAAARRGIDLSPQQARRLAREDVANFDLIIAMDRENYEHIRQLAGNDHAHRIKLFLRDFAPHLGVDEVPDPYYGGRGGFDQVLDLIEEGSQGLLNALRSGEKTAR